MNLLSNETRLMIFSPHADDEVLGCGGLITRIKEMGGEVYVCLFTYGESEEIANVRKKEFQSVMKFLQVDSFSVLFPDLYHMKLDTIPYFDIIQAIETNIKDLSPNICALPYASFNQDHRVVYETGMAALRSKESFASDVLLFEYPQACWGLYDPPFNPNFYIDIGRHIEKKIECFKMYRSQNKSPQYAISVNGIRSLAHLRGTEICRDYAEAYVLKRGIQF